VSGTAWRKEEDDDEFRGHSGELGALDYQWLRRLNIEEDPPPQQDTLAPANLVKIAGLMGLKVLRQDFIKRPDIAAIYIQHTRNIGIDWNLFSSSFQEVSSEAGWCRTIRSSRAMRFLVAWMTATHLVGDIDVLQVGFVPREQRYEHGELQRLAHTWEMVVHLTCPETKLIEQAEGFGIPEGVLARRDWRDRVARFMTPDTLVGVLAQRNQCFKLLIELQLDRYRGLPSLGHLIDGIFEESPVMRMQAIRASRFLARTAPMGTQWADVRLAL
jgi:hypothetical protein